MKTLLGLVASPRKYGNSELFIKELFGNLPNGWRLRMLRLPELDIRPCIACYQCLFGPMRCVQRDDLDLFLQELTAADAVALAAPTYFLGANASLKKVLDRGLSFYAHMDALWAKPAVGVAIAGVPGLEGYTKLMVDSFLKLILSDHRGSQVLYGALPGEIFLQDEAKECARRLASALTQGPEEAASPRCRLCGGDTFRFLPPKEDTPAGSQRIRCMVCSNEGAIRWDGASLEVDTRPGLHPLFLTYDDAKAHLEWLRTMKDAFLAKRKELKEITRAYAAVGQWVRPEKKQREERS